jgi:putative toxin-antitoxin system antitoxin component (TIGR02293 family)
MSTVAERLENILERGRLDYVDVARILETNPRTVARWVRRETEPRWEVRERLLEFFAVMERLQQVIRPQTAHDWLYTPNPTLDHEKPVDLLRRGEFRRVLAIIDALGEGVFI